MNRPVQITYRHMTPSEALSAQIQERAQHLEDYGDHILSCHVVVEAPPHQHQRQSHHFRVCVTAEVPGAELVAEREATEAERANAHQVVAEAFRALKRQLQDHVHRAR